MKLRSEKIFYGFITFFLITYMVIKINLSENSLTLIPNDGAVDKCITIVIRAHYFFY